MNPIHTPQMTMSLLRAAYPWIAWAVVGSEMTRYGIRHYHIHLEFNGRHAFSSHQVRTTLGQFAHLSEVNLAWLNYIIKGGEYYLDGITEDDLSTLVKSRDTMTPTQTMLQDIADGVDIEVIKLRYPGLYVTRRNVIRDEMALVAQRRAVLVELGALKPFVPFKLQIQTGVDLKLAKYLNWAMSGTALDKKKHLIIWGETNTGKTRFLSQLRKFARCYDYSVGQSDWQDNFNPPYHFIILDEFSDDKQRTSMTLQAANKMMDGFSEIKQKYKPAHIREGDETEIPCIFVMNQSPLSLYIKDSDALREAWLGRCFILNPSSQDPITLWHEHWDKSRSKLMNFYDDKDHELDVSTTRRPAKLRKLDHSLATQSTTETASTVVTENE